MNEARSRRYIETLQRELVPALGCTEPIAIAYAAAKAREVLGGMPEKIDIRCSGNVIKNVKAVTVPNSKGRRGIEIAAALGAIGGNADRDLEVLQEIRDEHIAEAERLIAQGRVTCSLQEGVANLYVSVCVAGNGHSAQVTLVNRHTCIAEILRDGEVFYQKEASEVGEQTEDWDDWSVADILSFAKTVELDEVHPLLERQIRLNTAVAEAGLTGEYGCGVGCTLLASYGEKVSVRAKAAAAAASDARMGGCSLPVVTNSGSGNQGITVSLPVIEYAKELGASEEMLYRALLISNLLAVYQKHFIGSLSAFCGAVTAASSSGAAITYLRGGTYEQICRTIVNTVANVGGMVCDGAKPSCAAKIASAVDAAILASDLSMSGRGFCPGEGVVQAEIDQTIRGIGHLGRVGMKETDVTILQILIGKANL